MFSEILMQTFALKKSLMHFVNIFLSLMKISKRNKMKEIK